MRLLLNGGDTTSFPLVFASVGAGGRLSAPVQGIIDTGASVNLTSLSWSKTLIAMSDSEVVKSGRKIELSGLKGACPAYGFQVNINLTATATKGRIFSLPNSWLYFCEPDLPHQILIGQNSGLEGRAFFHLNGGRKQHWSLRNL